MVQISTTLCTGCGKCADNCSSQNIFIHSGKAQVRGGCFNCGQCVAICPQNAVSIPEYDMEDVKDYEENWQDKWVKDYLYNNFLSAH